MLSALATFIKEIFEQSQRQAKALGLVTALPNTDMTSLSDRSPEFVAPVALSVDESLRLLKAGVHATQAAPEHLKAMQLLCGGHPRSLATAAALYKSARPPAVPLPHTLAQGCLWKPTQGSSASVMAQALEDAYRLGDHTVQLGAMDALRKRPC